MPGTLWLGEHTRSRRQLSLVFGLDDLRFTASYWYADVDLYALEERYGRDFMARVYFHIAAFTANTLVSLRPDSFDPGPYARFCSPEFWALWKAIVRGIWAQWRYENDLPDYLGPELVAVAGRERNGLAECVPARVEPGAAEVLAFCGGGKDSLVSVKLLERANVCFDTLAYSSSVYGAAARQHALIDGLLDAANVPARARRRVWCYDDISDSPVLSLLTECGARTMTAAETPGSLFVALPLVLQHGYTYLCLGHERSADTGNFVWERTGEEVNHQWGKSHEAEVLLNGYINEHLVENCQYFSILKPVYDVLIFNLLAEDMGAVPYTHSCNLQKPWCGKCPKCAYVWINYMAYLPIDVVSGMFAGHGNLLDIAENQLSFRQMLGLEAHTPFECIGQVGEVRLAFELCRRKGLDGEAMRTFVREVPPVDVGAALAHYLQINDALTTLPAMVRNEALSQMRSAAARAMGRIQFANR
jgi:hypothetical protein